MSDAWSDGKYRSITNFLVNSPRGTVFLKSIDTSGIIKNADNLCDLLDDLVKEIGEEHVVQVVTDSASAYVSAGQLLMEKRPNLFWNPCAAHCLDLMLSDIGEFEVLKDTLTKAKEVTVFIYRHQWVLDMFRKYTKKKELARPAITRFATSYLTLKRFDELKIQIRAMFASVEWSTSSHGKSAAGRKVESIILDDHRFWKAIKFCMKCVLPLVKVLRLVDGDSKPAMGYIYEAMDRAKEQIAKNLGEQKRRYEKIWNVIDTRWDYQLHRPLHAAAYYLNPKFQYSETFKADREVRKGLYTTIERMYPDMDTRLIIDEQLEKFKNAEGMFGMDMAKLTRDKKQPALWWESFGEECKELQRLAIRVLSGTCSATGCERNWSIFDIVHSKRRNRLETQRMNALVFVKYNIQLELRQEKRQKKGDTYDPICLSDMESDDEWITEKEGPVLPVDHSWMDIEECFKDDGMVGKKRKRGPRNLNAYGRKKGKKKASELDDEDEIEVLDDNEVIELEEEEEEEEEEEFDEATMVDDDEDDDDVAELDLEDD
ncbi:hypothetical protein RHMOL_Rhmol08G0019000 [Rhododendron molle]|nr:hypothetical protein RHMOL_Rhmol08G0019000 [Rhododendron molle]